MTTRKLKTAVVLSMLSIGVLTLGNFDTCSAANTVTIDNETVEDVVYAELLDTGIAADNVVNIKNDSVMNGEVYGAGSKAGDANKNTVNISDSKTKNDVYAGYSFHGNAADNQVNVIGSELKNTGEKGIYGGYICDKGKVSGNTITVKNSRGSADLHAGFVKEYSADNTAEGNSIVMENSKFSSFVVGGGMADSNAIGNSVKISKSTLEVNDSDDGVLFHRSTILGGWSNRGAVSDNAVTIEKDSEIGHDIMGGVANKDNTNSVTNNSITITDSKLSSSKVFGGRGANVSGNKVTITSSNVGNIEAGPPVEVAGAWAEYSDGNATENNVSIENSNVFAYAFGGGSTSGNSTKNIINVSNSDVQTVTGGYSGKEIASDNFDKYIKSKILGTANNNTVNITKGIVSEDVKGGASWYYEVDGNGVTGRTAGGDANGNTVNIKDSNYFAAEVYGGISGGNSKASVSNNVVNITKSRLGKSVYGGLVKSRSGEDVANNNAVTIIDSTTFVGNVYGASASTVDDNSLTVKNSKLTTQNLFGGMGNMAQGNTVTLNKATIVVNSAYIARELAGAKTTKEAVENTVNIENGSSVPLTTYGGYSYGNTSKNVVNVTSSDVSEVVGGYSGIRANTAEYDDVINSKVGNATGNTVTVNKSTVGSITGGQSWYQEILKDGSNGRLTGGDVTDNVVNIVDSTIRGVDGGTTGAGQASNNVVEISDSQVSSQIYGGYTYEGDALNNIVNITNSNGTSSEVYGGYSFKKGNASGNTVNISGSTFYNEASHIGGGRSYDADASDNIVTIKDSELAVPVYGGIGEKRAIGNTVKIINSKKTTATEYNFSDRLYGGEAETATNNSVIVDNSTLDSFIRGGSSSNGTASGNVVSIINGSTILNEVQGGYSFNGNAIDNTVNIHSSHVISLIGGYSGSETADVTTGNLLNVYGMNSTVRAVNNFSFMNFYVPADAENGSTLLTIIDGVDATDLASVKEVKVGVDKGNTKLKTDDVVNLIANEKGIENFSATTGKVAESDYVEFDSKIGLNSDSTALIATITNSPNDSDFIRGGNVTEKSKSMPETAAAAVNLVNSGADTIADQAMGCAADAVSAQGAADSGMAPFATTGGSSQRLNSGSHVDTKGWGISVGFAKEVKNDSGKLLLGPVFEYGRANYDSYLDSGYHASGSTHYYGLGLMAKQTNNDGLYYEGSLRFGKLFSDYEADSRIGGKYDSSTKYFGFHAGLGKIVQLDEQSSLDFYGKYFLTHTFGYDTTMHANGREYAMHFGATNSNRIKLGTRYNYKVSKETTLYTGIAWQYEFSADNTCTIDGASTPSPSMKGSTGYLELGIKNEPNDKFECGIGITGSVGKTQGIGANLSLLWKF